MGKKSNMLKYPSMGEGEPTPKEVVMSNMNVLGVYEIIAVDRQECKIVKQKSVIGTEADKGLLDLDLSIEHQAMLKTGRLAVFQNMIGSFERFVPQVELKDLKIT